MYCCSLQLITWEWAFGVLYGASNVWWVGLAHASRDSHITHLSGRWTFGTVGW